MPALATREPQCPEVRQALALEKVVRASRPLPGMQESRQQVRQQRSAGPQPFLVYRNRPGDGVAIRTCAKGAYCPDVQRLDAEQRQWQVTGVMGFDLELVNEPAGPPAATPIAAVRPLCSNLVFDDGAVDLGRGIFKVSPPSSSPCRRTWFPGSVCLCWRLFRRNRFGLRFVRPVRCPPPLVLPLLG